MKITSPAFRNGDRIPSKYTCDGDDVNPPLKISDTPKNAQSLVVIVDDPKSPSGNWLHWAVWNIDPSLKEIPEDSVPKGAVEGETDFSEVGYGGPCPGSGEHEYRFMVFALDAVLMLHEGAARHVLEATMEGHVLDSSFITGRYQRVKRDARKGKTKKSLVRA